VTRKRIPTFTSDELTALADSWAPPPVRADLADAPRRRNAQPEHALQAQFIQWVDAACATRPELALGFAIPNARAGKLDAVLRYREGARSGPADWVLPLAHGVFHGLALELKVPAGKMAQTQRYWIEGMRRAQYWCDVPRRLDLAIAQVDRDLKLPANYDVEEVRIFARALIEARNEARARRRLTRKRA
jgi:hypothetical protein